MRSLKNLASLLLLAALLVLLSGCGFYLRSTNLGSYLATVKLEVAQSPLLEHEFKRVFALNNVTISKADTADLSIRLEDYEFQKSPSLVVPREGLIEYELIVQVTFLLWFDGDEEAAEEVSFSQAGRVRVHPSQLLSTSAEEQKVRTELAQGVIDDFLLDLYLRLAHEQDTE